jgi:hypothetical protein
MAGSFSRSRIVALREAVLVTQQSLDSVEALYWKLVRTFNRREAYVDHQVDWVFDVSTAFPG